MPAGRGKSLAAAMPPTVRAVIASRLAKLTPSARDIAEVASTVGRAFSSVVIAAATGLDEDDLVEGLDELWRRQIIRELDRGYDFTHDKLREVLHRSIPPARARRLHGQVADALTAIHAEDLGPVSRLIAAQLRTQAVRQTPSTPTVAPQTMRSACSRSTRRSIAFNVPWGISTSWRPGQRATASNSGSVARSPSPWCGQPATERIRP